MQPNLWELIGFESNPYNTKPLKPIEEDVSLLVGRKEESNEFLSTVESSLDGVCIISGAPGVGKTSFFNIQQYLIESSELRIGGKILAARVLCPVQPNDSSRELALRILNSLCKSVEEYCYLKNISTPKQIKEVGKWINQKGSNGFDIGLQILGCGGNFGRSVNLPSAQDVTFEGINDAIECVTDSIVNELGFAGAFIALDNLENLEDSKLSELLVSYRDTLFTIPCVWWVLIGQSGLGSLIQSSEPKVYERIVGSGIELKPISLDELYFAIEKRVQRLKKNINGKAPLNQNVHKHLYNASHGEIRFVFKYCESICLQLIGYVRNIAAKDIGLASVDRVIHILGDHMVNNQIDEEVAESLLKEIVKKEIDGLNLRPRDKAVLRKIGSLGNVRPKDFASFGFKSMQDFYTNYISKLYSLNLLVREQEGKVVKYKLRGISYLAVEFELI